MDNSLKEFYNVAIYIDYENVYKSLRARRQNLIRLGFFEKIIKWCNDKNRRVVKIAAYCNFDNLDLHSSYHQTLLQSYGIDTIHTSNQGKNYADMQISIDVLNTMFQNDNIDEFIIMSNDKDMTPLLNTIRFNKRKVSVITCGDKYNEVLCSFADEHIKFEDILKVNTNLLIDKIELEFWRKVNDYIHKNFNEYTNGNSASYNHYGLEYCLKNELNYTKVMIYELANILKNIYIKGELLFYCYKYKGTSYVGILPTDLKDQFTSAGLLKEEDIIEQFDIDKVIEEKYAMFDH